jgi:hypothetical protein
MATQPIFPATPKVGSGKVLTANTAVDGTGTLVTVFTAGANGSIVDSLTVYHLGTNVPTVLRVFIKDGANYDLILEKTVATNTVSQTTESVPIEVLFNGTDRKRLTLSPAAQLVACVGTAIAAGIQVTCLGGDY